jgi:Ca-activated chloride channel family protein
MRSLVAGLLLFLSAGAETEESSRLETLRYNPRERTLSALSALEQGDVGTALELLEAASRLDQDDPLTAFNSGTAKLIAGREEAATRLEEAAAVAPDHLQPAVQYNLGNARLAEQDPAKAIDAYKQALRLDPGHMEAKFNLEVAQRLLEQQRQQKQEQQEQQQQSQDSSGEQNEPRQQEDQQQDQDAEQEPEQEPGEQQGSDSEQEQQQDHPLPDFEDQEDMTADQAAAILEAVENLEREQRRRQAEERARRRAKSGKDW